MKRREFITFLGGATVAWPLIARAQQPAMPVIGFLSAMAPSDSSQIVAAFRQGLKDTGFVQGQNVAIEYRFAGHQNERLPGLAAELVHRQVAVIAAGGTSAALAAKAASTTIPVVFEVGSNPIQLGLVASLNRPGSNVTGVTQLNEEVESKRLELLHEMLPTARVIAVLINPTHPNAESQSNDFLSAAHSLGLELHVLKASAERDFDAVFTNLVQSRVDGLVISPDTLFIARQDQLAALTVRYAMPAIFENREFVTAGGLMSYGGSITDSYRLAGVYAARILKSEKPSELPVQRGTKVELYINLKTAKALRITVPLPLSGRADEVIE